MGKCREAFERHQAKLLNMSYEELKSQFGYQSQVFGTRYAEGSIFDKEFVNWEACWQSRQAEVDALKNLLEKDEYAHNLYYENANLQTLVDEKDKRIKEALKLIGEVNFPSDYEDAWDDLRKVEKALRGDDDINVTR